MVHPVCFTSVALKRSFKIYNINNYVVYLETISLNWNLENYQVLGFSVVLSVGTAHTGSVPTLNKSPWLSIGDDFDFLFV